MNVNKLTNQKLGNFYHLIYSKAGNFYVRPNTFNKLEKTANGLVIDPHNRMPKNSSVKLSTLIIM